MILIGGGSRSGKSGMSLKRLGACGERLGFIATARGLDDEMRDRIARHKLERDAAIVTWEEPLDVAGRIQAEDGRYDGIVVDCLTLWLTNMMLAESRDVEAECQNLVDAAAEARSEIILVTNEVGCGIVPENELARRFRDHAGWLNQRAAEKAAEVHWMIFGLALRLKG